MFCSLKTISIETELVAAALLAFAFAMLIVLRQQQP